MARLTGEMILSWVRRNFADFKIRKNGQEIVMPNPWGDSGAHFNISLVEKELKKRKKKGYWVHDWRPGHQQHDGSFLRFVQDYKGISFHEAVKEVSGGKVDPRLFLKKTEEEPEEEEEGPEEIIVELPEGARPFSEGKGTKAHEIALNYLNSRCITLEEALQHFIHYDSTSIIFPYVEFGMVVYWMRRSLIGKEFQYPPETIGVTKSEFLYNFDQVEPGSPVIAMEAIIDAISVGYGSVAYGGANLDPKQVKKIRMLNPSAVILAGDNDKPDEHGIKPGIEAVWYNYEMLRPFFKVLFAIPDDPHKDWNDVRVAGLDPRQMIKDKMQPATPTSLISLRNSK